MAGGNEVPVPKPHDRSRRGQRKIEVGGAAGRTQILDAAIASILELGFYRASTNEIARRANVSWGSIQYHFGSRESLLLAVVEELNRRFTASMDRASIEGETLEERLASLYECLSEHYGHPTYLARIQVILNLRHDPSTSADVATAVAQQAADTGADLRRLLRETLGDASLPTGDMVFHAIRGMALSHQLGDAIPSGSLKSRRAPATIRRELDMFLSGLAVAARADPATKP
jgi:AcrR family transcriptional regulator